MSCCTYRCTNGDNCPIRTVREAQEPATPLITDNSDGSSSGNEDLGDDTGLLICQGITLVLFAVSVVVLILL